MSIEYNEELSEIIKQKNEKAEKQLKEYLKKCNKKRFLLKQTKKAKIRLRMMKRLKQSLISKGDYRNVIFVSFETAGIEGILKSYKNMKLEYKKR